MIHAVPPGPALVQLYWMRAAILAREAQHSAARHQADLLVRALPASPVAFFVAGRIDSAFGAGARELVLAAGLKWSRPAPGAGGMLGRARAPTLSAQLLSADGLVLMRLGHYRAAIRAYDEVLRRAPIMGRALYGRGICERRLGKRRRGDLDIRIAKIDSPQAADQMEHAGLRA